MDDLMSFATDHLLMDPDSGQHSSAANVDQILGQVNKLDTSENSDIVLMEHDSDQNPSAANVDEILVQVNDKQLENAGTPTDVVFFEEKVRFRKNYASAVASAAITAAAERNVKSLSRYVLTVSRFLPRRRCQRRSRRSRAATVPSCSQPQ